VESHLLLHHFSFYQLSALPIKFHQFFPLCWKAPWNGELSSLSFPLSLRKERPPENGAPAGKFREIPGRLTNEKNVAFFKPEEVLKSELKRNHRVKSKLALKQPRTQGRKQILCNMHYNCPI
jgi:hypothetical protein